jgi:hypothetical protein
VLPDVRMCEVSVSGDSDDGIAGDCQILSFQTECHRSGLVDEVQTGTTGHAPAHAQCSQPTLSRATNNLCSLSRS